MDKFNNISIRGRVAYAICLFEKMLIHYKCESHEWDAVLEKLWSFTSVEFLDDWMYEFAEWLPESILEDGPDDAEFITEEEYNQLYQLYRKTNDIVLAFLKIIFDLGRVEIYAEIRDNSSATLKKLNNAIEVCHKNNIELISVEPFEKYAFYELNGWGKRFDGRNLSVILK